MRRTALPALLVMLVLGIAACGGDAPLDPGCTPGQTVACTGAGACVGGQICAADGRTLGPCVCTAGPVGPGDAGTTTVDAARDTSVTPDASPEAPPVVLPDAATPVFPDTAPPLPFRPVTPCTSEADYLPADRITATPVLKYSPACVKVRRGGSVTFQMDFTIHPLKRSTMRGDIANNPIRDTTTGTSATFRFDEAGFFGFHCSIHGNDATGANMSGIVWVTGDAPPGGGSVSGIQPSTRDFGSVAVGGQSDSFIFSVSNFGSAAVTNLAVNLAGADFVAPMADNRCAGLSTLAGGATCTIGVQFKPASRGLKTGTLIASGGGQTVTAALTGTGLTPAMLIISPMAAMFAGRPGTDGTPLTFNVANAGDVSTAAVTAALGGTDAASFKITSNSCLAPLARGATCQVLVATAATATIGSKSATLTLSSPSGGLAIAALTATIAN